MRGLDPRIQPRRATGANTCGNMDARIKSARDGFPADARRPLRAFVSSW